MTGEALHDSSVVLRFTTSNHVDCNSILMCLIHRCILITNYVILSYRRNHTVYNYSLVETNTTTVLIGG